MILLFDTNDRRAAGAMNSHSHILCWRDSAWRDSKNDPIIPDPTNVWFLVHNSDWDAFVMRLTAMDTAFHKRPVIRFTGGDPSGKPTDDPWVRYRSVSELSSFRSEELSAMDRWARGGCKPSETPWICAEGKSLYLMGLLILLKIACHILDDDKAPHVMQDSQEWNVSSSTWWRSRLDKEKDWPKHLREEWTRRKTKSSPTLDGFINWVKEGKDWVEEEEDSDKNTSSFKRKFYKLSEQLSKVI